MVLMSDPRLDEGRRRRGATRPRTAATSAPSITQLMTAIGVGWGISWLTVVVRLHALHHAGHVRAQGVLVDLRSGSSSRPSGSASSARRSRAPAPRPTRPSSSTAAFGGGLDPGPVAGHARADRDQHPQPLLGDARRALARHEGGALEGRRGRVGRRDGRADRVHPVGQLRARLRQLDRLGRRLDRAVGAA